MNTATNTITLNFRTMQATVACESQGWCQARNTTSVEMARDLDLLRTHATPIRVDKTFFVFDVTPAQQHAILVALS